MKTVMAFFFFLAFSTLAIADAPSIIGTWTGKSDLINWKGNHEPIDYQLKFNEMKGNYVTGVASWKASDSNSYSVGKEQHKFADENFIGTYDEKSNSYYLVETTEQSLIKVDMLDNGDINVIYLEAGEHAVVFNGVLKKK